MKNQPTIGPQDFAPDEGRAKSGARIVVREVVPDQRLRGLATLAAEVQGVDVRQAKAPAAVATAVRELNEIARLAAGTLLMRSGAKAMFQQRIAQTPAENFRGSQGRYGRAVGAALVGLDGALGGILPCRDRFAAVGQVLQAAFLLDVRDGNRNATHTYRAGAYLQDRMHTLSKFEGMMREIIADPARRGDIGEERLPGSSREPKAPTGLDGFTDAILPPGAETPPPGPLPDPVSPGEPDSGLCEDLGDLCAILFQEAAAALLSDPFIDLIDSVKPDCLCHNYDPNQIFVARPAQGRMFPTPMPADVRLYYRGEDVTANIVSLAPEELRFRIPPNSRTGYVYLRGLFMAERGGVRNPEQLCGFAMPDFPSGLEQGPAALISIIYPPIIDLLTANGSSGPEVETEACSLVDVCWRVHLSDQPPHLPVPPCGRIAVVVRDETGAVVAERGPQGCLTARSANDHAFTVEARSFANDQECGSAEPRTITIRRVAQLHLVREVPEGSELLTGTSGSFFVESSCPAPENGLGVQMTSSDAQALQIAAGVTIPGGQTRARVEFAVADDACGRLEVRAAAAGHREARLTYDLLRAPVLRWAITDHMPYAPPRAAAFTRFNFTVAADCVPQPESRLSWKLVRLDEAGQGEELPLWASHSAIGTFFVITPTAHSREIEVAGLVLGTWAIVAEVPDKGLVSNALAFEVDLCAVDITLDTIAVTEGQGLFEGDLELHLTAIVHRDPRPIESIGSFTPLNDFLRWPPFPADSISLGNGDSVQPRARIATYRVSRDQPIAADIEAIVIEDDAFLQFGTDVGTGVGRLDVSCQQETTLVMNVVIMGGVLDITAIGGGEKDCEAIIGEDLPPGERVCASGSFGTGPTGRVQLTFKATPRGGP